MKYASAIVLLCLAAPLAAGERCTKFHANRTEIARSPSVKPIANRVEIVRIQQAAPLLTWQRALLFEPQIL